MKCINCPCLTKNPPESFLRCYFRDSGTRYGCVVKGGKENETIYYAVFKERTLEDIEKMTDTPSHCMRKKMRRK
jgi:hypothetical protein